MRGNEVGKLGTATVCRSPEGFWNGKLCACKLYAIAVGAEAAGGEKGSK